MASSLLDVCRFNPTAGSTTDWTYSSAVTGYQSPTAAGVVSAAVYSYRAESADLTQWEIGTGAYSGGVFSRTTVLYNSSGTTAKINFSTVPQVAIVALLEDFTTSAGSGWALPNCTLAASVSSNLLTVSLKDNAGNDPSASSPVFISYRSATAATGSVSVVPQTAALSISTNATGATLGSSNATAFRFWVVSFNNSATNVLALINCSTATRVFTLDETQVASSTAISGTATAAGVFYTPNGTTVTSKAFRILGYVEYNATGLTTAGTYASSPNFIQTFGPGISKPGERLQTQQVTTASATSTSSATYVATNLTISPTLRSAANLVRADADGTAQQNVATAGCWLRVLSSATSATVGSENLMQDNTTNVQVAPASGGGMEKPNSLTPTYTAQIKSNIAANTVTFPGVGTAKLIFEEIMG